MLELGSGFNTEFTGRENVYLNGAVMGLTQGEMEERFPRIVEFADIGEFIDQPLKTYSTGMVVRLAFSVIAHVDADVLVIDEALAVGDAFFVQKCMRFLREFMKRGTILFVSHDTGAVVNLCDRALWLHKGEVLMDGAAREVTESYLQNLAEEAYGVPPRRPTPATCGPASDAALRLRSASDPIALMRAEAPRVSPASGQLQIFPIDLDDRSFGKGGARIAETVMLDEAGHPIQAVSGGDLVALHVRCDVFARLENPIVGFIVKDRLGQVLFSDNTFATYAARPVAADPGTSIDASFTFVMPILATGEYTVGVAVAEGTQANHVQHHWIHDALLLRSITRSAVTGLMGIPMQAVSLTVRESRDGRT
jgi:lipopolysaccharide transport system ATP-binding protein